MRIPILQTFPTASNLIAVKLIAAYLLNLDGLLVVAFRNVLL
jgi:hypothetical protein